MLNSPQHPRGEGRQIGPKTLTRHVPPVGQVADEVRADRREESVGGEVAVGEAGEL
ncbi:hypothetical protein [Streptomyces azureus]|uniref:hypothetical protein n=1 Tax=Streptomyces azureus TaxID=146537 RepID=UPI00143108C2